MPRVSSTTAYSVNWNNGLTFTNLTPQRTVSESIVDQMATFDPTFMASYYSGLDCGLTGAPCPLASFIFVLVDRIGFAGWIFALSPGSGPDMEIPPAPAHGFGGTGPRIVGAINTFNTPNGPVAPKQGALTGRSLHAFAETGETGWLAVDGNEYDPINTSANSIPASSAACSTFSGLARSAASASRWPSTAIPCKRDGLRAILRITVARILERPENCAPRKSAIRPA